MRKEKAFLASEKALAKVWAEEKGGQAWQSLLLLQKPWEKKPRTQQKPFILV